ncbi:hypothetical protein ABTX86_11030 [Streptomyces anulatus]|uniref:hypothetical protein n=1 Tax=Streptomyces anulatus TaxID=1892 RepID=UPI00332C2A42
MTRTGRAFGTARFTEGRGRTVLELELLPGAGVTLPAGAGTLAFGMSSDEVDHILAAATGVHRAMQCMTLARADYAELRHAHDAWLSGVLHDHRWSTVATFGNVVLSVAGGGPGRTDSLCGIAIDTAVPVDTASATAVVWDGVDLFGHPAEDIVSVLPGPTRPSAPAAPDVTVGPLGLWLRGQASALGGWSQLLLLDTPNGWEQCCTGVFACAAGGDGFTGILR